jgi:ribonuclease D
MQLPVENLLSPDAVRRLCWTPPDPCDPETVSATLRAQGARDWQVQACLPCLLEAMTAPVPPADSPVTGE